MKTDRYEDAYFHEGKLGTDVMDYPLPNPVGFIYFPETREKEKGFGTAENSGTLRSDDERNL
jgi:hypothetical protein